MVNVKRLSKEADRRIWHFSLRKQEVKRTQNGAAKLESEFGCLESMLAIYSKEVQQLKTKLKQRADFGTVIESEKRLSENTTRQAQMQTQIKDLQRKIKQREKLIEKAATRAESGTDSAEVLFLRLEIIGRQAVARDHGRNRSRRGSRKAAAAGG